MTEETQCRQVIEYILKYGSITRWDSIVTYHITNLPGRIFNLRERGFIIWDVWEYDKSKKFKRYGLAQNDVNEKLLETYGFTG